METSFELVGERDQAEGEKRHSGRMIARNLENAGDRTRGERRSSWNWKKKQKKKQRRGVKTPDTRENKSCDVDRRRFRSSATMSTPVESPRLSHLTVFVDESAKEKEGQRKLWVRCFGKFIVEPRERLKSQNHREDGGG